MNQIRISVSLSDELRRAVHDVALADGVTMGEWVLRLIRSALPGVEVQSRRALPPRRFGPRKARALRGRPRIHPAPPWCDECMAVGFHRDGCGRARRAA